jgi:hypothetical protein
LLSAGRATADGRRSGSDAKYHHHGSTNVLNRTEVPSRQAPPQRGGNTPISAFRRAGAGRRYTHLSDCRGPAQANTSRSRSAHRASYGVARSLRWVPTCLSPRRCW